MKDYNEIINLLEKYMSREVMQYLMDNDIKEHYYCIFYNRNVCKTKQTIIKHAKGVSIAGLEDIFC